MGQLLSDFCMSPAHVCYQVGKGNLYHLQHINEVLYRNFHPKRAFMLWLTMTQIFSSTICYLKHIAKPKQLALSATTTKCSFQRPIRSRKHQPMNLGHFISQIMQRAGHPSYPIKSNLTITSMIDTLGFKASFID